MGTRAVIIVSAVLLAITFAAFVAMTIQILSAGAALLIVAPAAAIVVALLLMDGRRARTR